MNCRLPIADCRLSPRLRVSASPRLPGSGRRGFTFTEILFAVMILGIGFIMVAAIFPVAIQQTEANNQETIAASIGRSATGFVEKLAQTQVFYPNAAQAGLVGQPSSVLAPTFSPDPRAQFLTIPISAGQTLLVPGQVWSLLDPRDKYDAETATGSPPVAVKTSRRVHTPWYLWNGVAKNLVVPSDPRFAAAIMYKRDFVLQRASAAATPQPTPAPFAQVIVIAVQARNKQVYTVNGNSSDIIAPNNNTPPTLVPRLFQGVSITRDATRVSRIAFPGSPTNTVVAENAYVVVSNDFTFRNNDIQHRNGHFNGRIFRIGNLASNGNANAWEFAPGSDLTDGDATFWTGSATGPVRINADVLVVGRAADPNNPNQFTGLAQDVSVYSSFVQIPN